MENINELRKELINLIKGKQAHKSFEDAITNFPPDHINTKPPNISYSFWHLLEHIRVSQLDIIDYIQDSDYQWPNWPSDYWPKDNDTPDMWNKTVQEINALYENTYSLLEESDLFAKVTASKGKHNLLREILIIADHNAYHLGQFSAFRQVLGI